MSPTEKHECAGYLMLRQNRRWEEEVLHRGACHGEASSNIGDDHYCLMRAPYPDKAEAFEKVFKEKIKNKDYNFRAAWFPADVTFSQCAFNDSANFVFAFFKGNADFSLGKFSADVSFYETQFEGEAIFRCVQFAGEADFTIAKFNGKDSNFAETEFRKEAKFRVAKFAGEAGFRMAEFAKGDFGYAEFNGKTAAFSGAEFTDEVVFSSAKFESKNIFFAHAHFNGNADFSSAQFVGGEADFTHVEFYGPVDLKNAHFFNAAKFDWAVFSKQVFFYNSVFEKEVFFDETTFKAESFVDFALARFTNFTRFMNCRIEAGAEFYFGETIFEKPEQVYFHSIKNLRPRWFQNTDTRKFNFELVKFPELRGPAAVANELNAAKRLFITLRQGKDKEIFEKKSPPYTLLQIACRRLAENAETNNRYEEAMGLRYMAMDCQRRAAPWGQHLPVTLHWWYWASSGYGERALRAAVMLILVWLLPFLFYLTTYAVFVHENKPVDTAQITEAVRAGFAQETPAPNPTVPTPNGLPPGKAAFYSLNVMAFQKPEPKPSDDDMLTRGVVILQTILGPVQATLLLLAIRRKFMR